MSEGKITSSSHYESQGWELSAEILLQFLRPRILFSVLAEPLFIKKKSEKRDQTDRLLHRPTTSECNMHLSSHNLSMEPRLNDYTKEFLFFRTSTFVFSLQLLVLRTIFDKRLRKNTFLKPVSFLPLHIHPLMKREIDLGTFVD